MIGNLTVTLSSKDPTKKCETLRAFVNSPSNVRIVGVPGALGKWKITKVYFVANYPDNQSVSKECTAGVGVYVATIPGSTLPGSSMLGYSVKADGVDENNQPIVGYVLGKGDVEIVDTDGTVTPGVTTHYIHVLPSCPASPREGDAYVENGTWRFYNGTTWTVLGGVSAGNSYVMAPVANGGDGKWHRLLVVDGTLAYDQEGLDDPPLAADKPWVLTQVSTEAARAAAAEATKVPTDGNATINGTKTFTSSPLVPNVASTSDNSTKAASTGWVTSKLASWWSSVCSAAVSLANALTVNGQINALGGIAVSTGNTITTPTPTADAVGWVVPNVTWVNGKLQEKEAKITANWYTLNVTMDGGATTTFEQVASGVRGLIGVITPNSNFLISSFYYSSANGKILIRIRNTASSSQTGNLSISYF